MTRPPFELNDMQGLLRTGFGSLTEAVYLLLYVKDSEAAKAWLADLKVTSVTDLAERQTTAVQVAISAMGLIALGVDQALRTQFSAEFVTGMSGDPSRSRRLGDVGASAPEHWAWGGVHGDPHLLVMLYALPGGLGSLRDQVETAQFAEAFAVMALPTTDMAGREPFGFVDGVSQPKPDWEAARRPGTSADLAYGNLVATGEFVLGYENEYRRLTRRPTAPASDALRGRLPLAPDDRQTVDLGKNGSYLVFRQLAQDVRGFWRFSALAGGAGGALAAAEAMVGRRINGEAMAAPSSQPIAGVGPADGDIRRNRFTYDADPQGTACPIGAHVRRTNPRTGDMPGGAQSLLSQGLRWLGLKRDGPRGDMVASTRFHRILRRGREYGQILDPGSAAGDDAPNPQSGLNFICLNANISRQFEFVQGAWAMSAKFAGLSGEQDPLLGNRAPFPAGVATDGFSCPQTPGPARQLGPVPQFVTVVGGAYFFLPGLQALRFIAGQDR